MSKVLIISKTRMFNGVCIGGIIIPDLKSVRLMNEDGGYHKTNTDFETGQLWEMSFKTPEKLTPPHIENVLIQSRKFIKNIASFADVIGEDNLSEIVWKGHPQNLFEGCLSWTGNRHGFIQKAIPAMSTGFWIPDRNLVFDTETYNKNNKKQYYIYDDGNDEWNSTFGFKYVGFQSIIPMIAAGTRVRVSLAKWWHPDELPDMPDRCYLQLSGWYDT